MSQPNSRFTTQVRPHGTAVIEEAAQLILRGLPVAVPTETVYGLAADATNSDAVARIYEAKGRPSFNPLIVHVRDLEQAERYGSFSASAREVAEAFWPGALTIVVPRMPASGIAELATAGLATIALRCPRHSAMRDLLEASDKPLAAPSANASGGISPTSARHVLKTLDGRVPLVIDGGETEQGIESTIVGFFGDGITLLRPGPIDILDIIKVAGLLESQASGGVEAPGQLASHYAPSKPLRLNAARAEPGEWLIGFGQVEGDDSLSRSGNLVEAAARLFEALHRAEAQPLPKIAVAPIPETGIGAAINDRLARAAAPRGT